MLKLQRVLVIFSSLPLLGCVLDALQPLFQTSPPTNHARCTMNDCEIEVSTDDDGEDDHGVGLVWNVNAQKHFVQAHNIRVA